MGPYILLRVLSFCMKCVNLYWKNRPSTFPLLFVALINAVLFRDLTLMTTAHMPRTVSEMLRNLFPPISPRTEMLKQVARCLTIHNDY